MVRRKESDPVKKVIEMGGDVSADKETDTEKEWKQFNIRLMNDMSRKIDELISDRPWFSKTVWILEAIDEKLKREGK